MRSLGLPAGVATVTAMALGAGHLARSAEPEPARPDTLEEPTWKRLLAYDEKAAGISDLSADFRQEKFTALLKRPLVSGGTVRMTRTTVRWDTQKPRPSAMLVRGGELKLHYPEQSLLEVYQVQRRFRDIAASPVLRLPMLLKHFTPHRIASADLDPAADAARHLALRLAPREESIKGHLRDLRVLLEAESGNVVKVEMTDADGERTVVTFSRVRYNTGMKDAELELQVPPGTTVSRPLQAVEGKGGSP
jgi:hypothetical protein